MYKLHQLNCEGGLIEKALASAETLPTWGEGVADHNKIKYRSVYKLKDQNHVLEKNKMYASLPMFLQIFLKEVVSMLCLLSTCPPQILSGIQVY